MLAAKDRLSSAISHRDITLKFSVSCAKNIQEL